MSDPIRAVDVPNCLLCGAPGTVLYERLSDRVFLVPGQWAIRRCAGSDCGLLWLNPMPAPEEVHRIYECYYTHAERPRAPGFLGRVLAATRRGYLANQFGYRHSASTVDRLLGILPWLVPGRPAELNFSVMWLDSGPSASSQLARRLLDVGAGSGWLVDNFRSVGWQAEGIDFDPRAVQRARERGLHVHHGGFAEQSFPEASFNAVTMSHSLEHVHDPVAWLAEARRVLRPGGRLALATPNSRSFMHRRFRESWFPLEPPRHLYLFNREALARALDRAGFRRFRIFTSARDAAGVYLASRSIRETKRHDMMRPATRRMRLLGRAVQSMELLRLLSDPDAGEDLIALAEK